MPDNGDNPRLERIEGIIETLANRQVAIEEEFARLLRVQVVLTDTVQHIADNQQRHEEELRKLAEQTELMRQENEERFSALIKMMDEWIRNNRNNRPSA